MYTAPFLYTLLSIILVSHSLLSPPKHHLQGLKLEVHREVYCTNCMMFDPGTIMVGSDSNRHTHQVVYCWVIKFVWAGRADNTFVQAAMIVAKANIETHDSVQREKSHLQRTNQWCLKFWIKKVHQIWNSTPLSTIGCRGWGEVSARSSAEMLQGSLLVFMVGSPGMEGGGWGGERGGVCCLDTMGLEWKNFTAEPLMS